MSEEIQKIKEKILPILKDAGVLRSSVFGSVARGEATTESDVDILVQMPKKASLFDLAGLQIDLQNALGKKVDVVEFDGIKPILRQNILGSQIRIL